MLERQSDCMQVEGAVRNPGTVPVFHDALEVAPPPPWLEKWAMGLSDDEAFHQVELLEAAEDLDEREQRQVADMRGICESYRQGGVDGGQMRTQEATLFRQWLNSHRVRRWQRYLLAADDERQAAESSCHSSKAERWEAERRGYGRLRHGKGWNGDRRRLTIPRALHRDFEDFGSRVRRLDAEWREARWELEQEREKQQARERGGGDDDERTCLERRVQDLTRQVLELPKRGDENVH